MLIPVCVLLSVLNRCLAVDLTYYVKEGQSPGTLVGDITADTHLMDIVPLQDQRMITFSQLKQHEASISQLFRVSKNTGKLFTTQMLDAEAMCKPKKECDKMMDIAVRKGTSFIKLLEIKVIIRDVNDHQPEFPDKQASIQFSEGDGIGMRKSIPNAMDRDVGVLNSQITYQLKKNKDEPFTLSISERVDGTSDLSISLEERLDREVKDSYMIQVIAKDEGSPPKQDVLDVYISVIDVNDNAPVFSQKVYNVSVNNEYDRTTPVVILSASDLDSEKNGKISYRFSSKTSAVARNFFELIEETGEIFLWKKFALEQGLTYELYIEATDGGNPPLSALAMVLVNVINQQNNPPSIDLNFVFASSGNTTTISEDIEVGSFIAYVKVTDYDVGQNGEIICDLHHDKFQLQNLGTKKYKVIIKKSLDTESEDHHEITISCQDKGSPSLHSESKFSVQVMDVNDVQPQFFKETYKFRIYENQKSKIPVGFINATDPDQGPGGKLTYSLLTNNKQFLPFQITNDGLISTISSLDHEFQDMYKFQVMVKDNGIPSLNNSVNVIVEVRDENDNAPYFTFPSVNPFVMDILYFPHHTRNITMLRASDSDSRENAFLKYEITAGNDKQLFTLNHYTGLLYFTREVTHHDTGSYELEFVVKDSGTPVLSATTTLSLTLTVSNKTSEVLNAVQIQTGDKIHLNLVIIVTLIAVTLSVVITASMSICILRYSNRINAPEGDVVNPPQRHLMCPSYHANSWPDVPGAITTDPTLSKNVNLTAPRRESHPGDEFGNQQKGSPQALKPRSTADITCQERAMLAAGEKHEHSPIMTLGYNTWRSTKSSHTDSRRGWSEGETGHGEKVPDLFLPQYCVLPPSQTDQLHINDLKSLQETFNFPSEATAGARILYKPSTGQQTQWTAPKSATLGCGNTDFQPQLKTLSTSSHRISYPRPLPPVPK